MAWTENILVGGGVYRISRSLWLSGILLTIFGYFAITLAL